MTVIMQQPSCGNIETKWSQPMVEVQVRTRIIAVLFFLNGKRSMEKRQRIDEID